MKDVYAGCLVRIGKNFARKSVLIYQLSRANLRISSITLIGMIIAISMISSCLIYSDTQKENQYRLILEESDFSSGIEFRHSSLTRYLDPSRMETVKQELQKQLDEYKLSKFLIPNSLTPFYTFTQEVKFFNQMEDNSIISFDFNEILLSNCIEGSKLPSEWNEVILFSPNESFVDIGDNFTLKIPFYKTGAIYPAFYVNYSMTISGIMTLSSIENDSIIEELYLTHQFLLITNIDFYFPLIERLRQEFLDVTAMLAPGDSGTWPYQTIVHFPYKIDSTKLNYNNVVDFVNRLEAFFDSKTHSKKIFRIDGVEISLYQDFYTFKEPLLVFHTSLLLFIVSIIPIFFLAFLLVSYSISLINERRKKALVLLKNRGFSTSFIFFILSFESIILAIIASIIGLFLGIPFSLLLGELLKTSKSIILNKSRSFVLTSQTMSTVILIGIFFTIISLLPSAIRLSRIEVADLAEESSRKKKQRFKIFTSNLDIMLIAQGIIGLIIFHLLMNMIDMGISELSEISLPMFSLLIYLLIFSPLAILIGSLLFYNRFIPLIIQFTGNFLWKRGLRLSAIVTRNLSGNLRLTQRTTLILAVSVSFLMILSIGQSTLTENRINEIYGEAGCDLKITLKPSSDPSLSEESIQNLTADLQEISGLTVTRVSFTNIWTSDAWRDTVKMHILGIDKNFFNVAFWKTYFDDDSLEDLVSSIFSYSNETSAIIDPYFLKSKDLQLGSIYRVYMESPDFGGSYSESSIPVVIRGVSNNWPGFYDKSGTDRYMIVSRNLIDAFKDSHSRSIWCKISKDYDQTYIMDQARNITKLYGVMTYDFQPTIEQVIEDTINPSGLIFLVNLVTIFNGFVLFIIIIIVIFFFTYIRITSHTVEIGLSRALGMKFRQIFFLMFTEPFVLFLLSGVPGGLIGSSFLIGIFYILSTNFVQGLPFLLYIDFISLILYYLVILIIMLSSGLISSWLSTRANVSKILKVE